MSEPDLIEVHCAQCHSSKMPDTGFLFVLDGKHVRAFCSYWCVALFYMNKTAEDIG